MASPTASGEVGGKAEQRAVTKGVRGTRHRHALRPAQGGFTYLWLLFVLAISAAGTAAVGELWTVQVQRSKELDLAFRGQAVVAALESYRAASPAGTPCAPQDWEDLLQDQRSTVTLRHLRRPYANPFAPSGEWEWVKDTQGRMLGVKSRPPASPIVTAPPAAGKAAVTADASGARVFQIGPATGKLVCLNAPPAAAVGSVDTQDSMKAFQNK
jgi:type II secretory pathway pseudopilin PulG